MFGGDAYKELSEISPKHQFFAYTMYDQENDYFRLSVRNLPSGSLCSKPQADRVSVLAWVKGGKALLYGVTDHKKRPYRLYFSTIGSTEEDVLLLEELDENVCVNIRHTKDYNYVTVNTFSPEFSKVFLINTEYPLTSLTHIWEGEGQCHCIVEHHKGFIYSQMLPRVESMQKIIIFCVVLPTLLQIHDFGRPFRNPLFADEDKFAIEDVDFSEKYLALVLRESGTLRICSVALPLPVGQMPDAVVVYDLSNATWKIVQQQNLLHERTRLLYGTYPDSIVKKFPSVSEVSAMDNPWNELSEFYSCEKYQVPSHDGVMIPLTIVYSRSHKKEDGNPGLLYGLEAYGEILDKRWRSEPKSLLDRGWIIAFANVSCIMTAVEGEEAGVGVMMADGQKNKTQLKIMYPLPDFLLTKGLFRKTNLRVGDIVLADFCLLQPSTNVPTYFVPQF